MEEILSDLASDSQMITNLNCKIDDNNIITVNFNWPSLNHKINYVYAYEVEDENETLQEIINRKAKAHKITRLLKDKRGNYFTKILEEKNIKLKLFPVCLEKGVAIIFNQKENNCTQTFYKRIILKRRIIYNYKPLLGNFYTVSFEFFNRERLLEIPENALLYYKSGKKDNSQVIWYPMDLELAYIGGYEIYVEKEYDIDLICNKDYEGSVVIRGF